MSVHCTTQDLLLPNPIDQVLTRFQALDRQRDRECIAFRWFWVIGHSHEIPTNVDPSFQDAHEDPRGLRSAASVKTIAYLVENPEAVLRGSSFTLFCAIGGHKFDTMYTGVTPLHREPLETLNRPPASSPANVRDLIADTVPFRPTHLLHHLMKPLVSALHAGSELIMQDF